MLRNLWGHPLILWETPDPSGAASAPVPGAGEAAQVDPSAPPSGATQPVADQDPPGPIPYARFQEVNNQRRELEQEVQPFRELVDAGYDAANLQRLTQWEAEYMQDPVGTWLRQAEQIEGLPAEVKAAIEAAGESAGRTQGDGSADATPPQQTPTALPDDEPPAWAQPLIEDHRTRQEREQAEAISSFYDGLVTAWKEIDEQQGITTPDEAIHAHIASAAPNAASAQDILRTAREQWLAVREATLGSITRPGGNGPTPPQPVPGSGAGGSAPPVRPRTMQEARRLAESDPMFSGSS